MDVQTATKMERVYREGRQAYRDGYSDDCNPYAGTKKGTGLCRTRWFDGWLDEKNKRFFE